MRNNLLRVFAANIISLIIGLFYSFLLPRNLSIESYAMIKTFTLLISYSGFFHLGYLDGMYIKFGGKQLSTVSPYEFGSDYKNVMIMQAVASFLVVLVGVVMRDPVVILFSFALFFINMISCHQLFYQAIGEFKSYGKALNYRSYLLFALSIILLIVIKSDNYILYIVCQVLSAAIALVYLAFSLNRRLPFLTQGRPNLKMVITSIGSGFGLMIGNFASILFSEIDRWLVKIWMSTLEFATYSFAAGLNSMISVFTTPISLTLYNAFCKDVSTQKIIEMKRMVLIWGVTILALAFPAKWIIINYIDKYIEAIPIVFLLFASQVFYTLVKSIYVNYYKANKQQNKYLIQTIIMMVVSLAISTTMLRLFDNVVYLAIGSISSAFIWLLFNEIIHKNLRFGFWEWLYLILMLGLFITYGFAFSAVHGLTLYGLSLLLFSLTLLRKTSLSMLRGVLDLVRGVFKRGKSIHE